MGIHTESNNCKNRKALKPLNSSAVEMANKAQPKCNSHAERKNWMDNYLAAGGAWECVCPKEKKPSTPVAPCPLGVLIVTVKDSNGKPVLDVEVTAGALGPKKTNKDGIVDYGKVETGIYTVKAKRSGHAPKRNDPEGEDSKTGINIIAGSTTTVNLIQHPICANVSFFEGSTTRTNYFGFDHRTNQVVTLGTDEYWLPTPASGTLTLPTDKQTRDGGRWVSVAVGKETEVEINFAFKTTECIPCITNSTFEVKPATIAEVVTVSVTAKKAIFKIKGKAEGEASLKVICDGNDIGWFHIWSKNEATLQVDVVNLITNRAPVNAFSIASLEAAFNEIYNQAAIEVDMIDLGSVDLTGDAVFAATESAGYPSTGRFLAKTGSPKPYDSKATILNALDVAASVVLSARTTAPLPRVGAYRIYRYIPTVGAAIGGTVLGIGSSPAFAFISDSAAARNSMAHEFGHCLGLKHPSDGSSGSQFATHNRLSCNVVVPAYVATNTEPASVAASAKSNIMAKDPTNLMGYWSDKPNRKPLRYHQWVACSRS